MMPLDLPPWQTVYYYYRNWRQNGFWQWLHDLLYQQVRRKQGKAASPSVAIMDSQSVKTSQMGGQRGYDPAKRIKGRKRHLLVDTVGLLIVLVVHRADIDERQGARYLLNRLLKRRIDFKRLKVFFADQGYSGQNMQEWVAKTKLPLKLYHLEGKIPFILLIILDINRLYFIGKNFGADTKSCNFIPVKGYSYFACVIRGVGG